MWASGKTPFEIEGTQYVIDGTEPPGVRTCEMRSET